MLVKRIRLALSRHLAWISTQVCSVPGCTSQTRIECHHEPPVSKGGESSDSHVCPLCAEHHAERHALGLETFNAKYRIDLHLIVLSLIEKRLAFLEGDEIPDEPKSTKQRKTSRKNRLKFESYINPFK
jgi:hypothetical protein